ncbi:MFS transporter [Enterococcus mediterraneensis]|uniref:MFS transporter n=1 Tax=Enterococcus mediterraneensis TaxID=2364791 RepID=UPI001F14D0D5|nr:glycoside-pentoside-hexuronide (GPH):cation symporter [Enterococcus mediterraneensis]
MDKKQVKISEKIGFTLTNLGNIPIMTLLNTYLLIFYTDVVGISPAVVGGLFLASRLLDGISDPLLGFLIDRFPHTKIGKYKPVLILGVIICCLNYLLVWFAPVMFESQKIVAISISYILLGITFDLMDIPLNSLIPVLTKNEEERNTLSSIKGVSYTVGPTLLNVAAPLAISAFSTPLNGYILLISGAVLVVLFFTIIGALMLKERVSEEEVTEHSVKEKYTMKEAVRILRIKPVVTLFLSMLFITAATNIFNGSLLYYLSYIVNNTRLLSIASLFGMFAALIAGAVVSILTQRINKKQLYILGLCLVSVCMAGFLLFGETTLSFVVLYCGVQFSLGLTNTLQYSISADNVDIIREQLGVEATALVASLTSLIMKFAMAVGGAIPGFILSYTGYIANQAQSIEAANGIMLVTFAIPLVLYLATVIIFRSGFKFKVAKKQPKLTNS